MVLAGATRPGMDYTLLGASHFFWKIFGKFGNFFGTIRKIFQKFPKNFQKISKKKAKKFSKKFPKKSLRHLFAAPAHTVGCMGADPGREPTPKGGGGGSPPLRTP